VIRKDNGTNNSLFLSCQMGLSDGPFFMIKHTPLPNGNHPILSLICPMGVADTLGLGHFGDLAEFLLLTSATSASSQLLAEDVSFYIKYCL
jgi:hypothetical protein